MKNAFTNQAIYCKIFTYKRWQSNSGDETLKNNGVVRIKAYYPSFSHGEQKIADYMLANLDTIQRNTISELANNCHTSTASISRFVKRIGYSNYRDFLFNLATTDKAPSSLTEMIEQRDTAARITEKTFNGAINALQSTKAMLNERQLNQAVALISKAQRVTFFGLGGSSIVALNGYHKFLRTSLDCQYHSDFDIQMMQAVKMTKKECAIIISHSGENNQTVAIARRLHQQRVPMIVISSSPDSSLAQLAEIRLISVAENINERAENLSSLVAQLTIMDSLFLAVATEQADETAKVIDEVNQAINQTYK